MNRLTADTEYIEKKADPNFRQTLLHLPSLRDCDLNLPNDVVANDSDSRNFDKNRTNAIIGTDNSISKKPAVSPATLVIPIDTSDGLTAVSRQRCGLTIDEHIATGNFPALLLANQALRQQTPLLLLNEIKEIDKTHDEVIKWTQSSRDTAITADISPAQRVLYVAQGEIAHCTAAQVDILVSDRATTCHILALRSTCNQCPCKDSADSVLCSIAHLDAMYYSRCIRDAFQTHYEFHCSRNLYTAESDTEESCIIIDVHIVGGFKDTPGSSLALSTWIMNLLADLADIYYVKKPSMTIMLRTACITAANHNHKIGGPVVRGIGLNCDCGNVFVACAKNPGPAMNLRMAKTWLSGHSPYKCDATSISQLSIIHTYRNDTVAIEPLFAHNTRTCQCGFIQCQMQEQFQQLLGIRNDKVLLKYCSTSPEYEEDDFCTATRSSLMFILKQDIADPDKDSTSSTVPLYFNRVGSNTWIQIKEK